MEPQLLTLNFFIKEPLLSKVISFLEAKRVTDKNTAMFIMTGKKGHYQSMPQTAAANVSGHTEAPRVLDLSLKHAGSDVTQAYTWQLREDCPRS